MRTDRVLMLALLWGMACSAPSSEDAAPSPLEVSDAAGTDGAFGGEPVVRALLFRDLRVASVSGGLSNGFDLDGRVSTGTDGSCGGADFIGPEGTPGIDNGVGTIWPAFYDVLGASIESLFRDSVTRGGDIPALLVGNDALWTSARLDGAAVDFDGLLAGYQTFEQQGSGQVVEVIQSGERIEVGPWNTDVIVPVFGAPLSLPVLGLRMNLQRDGAGIWRGIAAGSFDVAAIPEVLGEITSLSRGEAVADALLRAADLPDAANACRRISFASEVEAVEGFVAGPLAP
jgi:hypothetical protein